MKAFWNSFAKKDFKKAQQAFDGLADDAKQSIFAELFQKSEYANQPHSISVLFRELHDGKTFDDFHEAWFPPKDLINTETVDGQVYHQFFKAPIRVINAVNLNNPKEVISVGIHWLNEEQAKGFAKMLSSPPDEANERRGNAIDKVADHVSSNVYIIKSDDNLGTPF
jgi:hypothetical protein